MTIRPPAKEIKKVQIIVDQNPVETSFEKWAKPGHFSKSLSRGPNTTTWIWNLHADAHDFDSHTSDLEDISRKVVPTDLRNNRSVLSKYAMEVC